MRTHVLWVRFVLYPGTGYIQIGSYSIEKIVGFCRRSFAFLVYM
ncbi:hypothetical protein HMPREF1141_3510 [Clostridium sp. MSTE9]|nr:hypothetical protein HMPREF1141_3510 [Clostridium sp. MSTE9]